MAIPRIVQRLSFLWLFCILLVCFGAAKASPAISYKPIHTSSFVTLPAYWDVLAPFSIGTREFGADPLEAFGGIREIYKNRGSNPLFPSELVFGGYVRWSTVPGGDNVVSIAWNTSVVNWPLIESWGGLTSSQFQGWAIGRLNVRRSGMYTVTCTGVTSFYIDHQPFRGDVYGLGYGVASTKLEVSDTLLLLIPLSGMENTAFQCGFSDISPNYPSKLIELQDHVVPDIVVYNGQNTVAGAWFGLSVLNIDNQPLTHFFVASEEFKIVQQPTKTQIFGNQGGIINFQVDSESVLGSALCQDSSSSSKASFKISFVAHGPGGPGNYSLAISVSLSCRFWGLPYAFTFLDIDRSVQYAATRPPAFRCLKCPVLFTFHGAGVYARKDAWVYAYQQQNTSWLLFPTNRRQFGFDWEGPGKTNAWYAFNALLSLPGVPQALKSSYGINPQRIQYAGHSMGGHGCWYISTHAPDRALSVSPAAGWIKMGMYIPFFTRVSESLADPFLVQILMSSIAMHNTDFYMRNLKGIPLMVRMGALDDNVPPFHLKRMARIHNQLEKKTTATVVSEIPGESHWWGGVVDDAPMQAFFNQHVNTTTHPLPKSFTASFFSPADFESRGAIQPIQLSQYGRAAYIHVERSGGSSDEWTLTTMNVKKFRFIKNEIPRPNSLIIDGKRFQNIPSPDSDQVFCKISGSWQLCQWEASNSKEKGRESIGPISRILEGPITIVYGTSCQSNFETDRQMQFQDRDTDSLNSIFNPTEPDCRQFYQDQALFLANSLYYQGRYTPRIIADKDLVNSEPEGNLIILGGPEDNVYLNYLLNKKHWPSPVSFLTTEHGFQIGHRKFIHVDSATAYIVPSPDNYPHLMQIVAGNSFKAVKRAVGLIPTKSSWTVPDWVVTGPEFGWNGVGGLLGAGYWSNEWMFDPTASWISDIDEF
jgi:hypothetical protein